MHLIARVVLPLLLFGYIALETYMKLHHTSLCDATGCKLAGELLRFDAMYLYYFGGVGALLLAVTGAISMRSARFERIFEALLLGALAFEAVMFSYQVAVNPEPCLFCMGVLGGLTLIALTALRNKLIPLFLLGAVGTSLAMLATVKNAPTLTKEGTYLFYSPTCPHCKKVERYFKEHHIDYTPLSVTDASARRVLHYLGIDKIPVLVVKKGSGYAWTVGDEAIIRRYETAASETSAPTPTESSAPAPASLSPASNGLDTLLQSGGEEGCTLSVVPDPSCSGEEGDK